MFCTETLRSKIFHTPKSCLLSRYNSEIRGIAEVVDMPLGEVVLYNVFYEVFTVCTSIVGQANNGTLYHARNLDFGLFLGWDPIL